MKFTYTKQCSVTIGQELYAIIGPSIRTYGGVYKVVVSEIDYNMEQVIFDIDQPCNQVCCSFADMDKYVFESQAEAEKMYANGTTEGLHSFFFFQ